MADTIKRLFDYGDREAVAAWDAGGWEWNTHPGKNAHRIVVYTEPDRCSERGDGSDVVYSLWLYVRLVDGREIRAPADRYEIEFAPEEP